MQNTYKLFKALAIDTNVFVSNQFDFSGKKLGLLRKYNGADVQILVPRIIYYEMLKHFKKKCDKERGLAQKGLKSMQNFWEFSIDYQMIENTLNDERYASDALMDFVNEIGADIISCNGIDVDKVVDLYVNCSAPFDDTKKKREEFPDALALLSLEKWAMENHAGVLFVSEDKKAKEFCKKSDSVKCVDSLAAAYQHFLSDDSSFLREFTEMLRDLKLEDQISEHLADYVERNDVYPDATSTYVFDLYKCYAEFESYGIGDVANSIKVIDLNSDEAVVEIVGTVDYTLHAEFILFKYDSSDNDYVELGTANVTKSESEIAHTIVTFSKDEKNTPDSFEITDIEFSQIMHNINMGDLEPDWMSGIKFYKP